MELTWITFPTDRGDRQPGRVLCRLLAQGQRSPGQQGRCRGHRPTGGTHARQDVGQPVQPAESRLRHSRRSPAARSRPGAGHSTSRRTTPAARGYRSPDELVQLARRPVRRHGKLRPPVQLRRRRLCLPARRRSRAARKRADPDLEHQVPEQSMVRSGRPRSSTRT